MPDKHLGMMACPVNRRRGFDSSIWLQDLPVVQRAAYKNLDLVILVRIQSGKQHGDISSMVECKSVDLAMPVRSWYITQKVFIFIQ